MSQLEKNAHKSFEKNIEVPSGDGAAANVATLKIDKYEGDEDVH